AQDSLYTKSCRRFGARVDKTDSWDFRRLLRSRRQRPSRRRAAEQRDELASVDVIQLHQLLCPNQRIPEFSIEMLGVAQQRDLTLRLTILRFPPDASSMAITPKLSASLMAARTLALPMLARSAMRATGSVHFPVISASFRMTASTAIASVFRCSATSGGTST